MEITNCVLTDTGEILSLYQSARDLQTQRKMVVWPSFDESFIEKEILEGRQWKVVVNDIIVCNWAIAFEDKAIWGDMDQDNSIYIHRICTRPEFRGNRYIEKIVEWAKIHSGKLEKRFVRLDTLGDNTRLIEHYTSAGFRFLGMFNLTNTESLPKHYQDEPNACLFEIDLQAE